MSEPTPGGSSGAPEGPGGTQPPARHIVGPDDSRGRTWIIVGIVAAVVVVGILAFLLLRGGNVSVPKVVGLAETAATAHIQDAGLTVGKVVQVASVSAPLGTVTAQSPSAGASVAKGSAVDLTVSSGPASATVPDVVGLTQNQAVSKLAQAGFTARVIEEFDKAPKGQVFGQLPQAGTETTAGAEVAVAVSLGPSTQTSKVPNVVGLTQSDAETAISNAGFTPVVLKEHSSTVASGKVIAQMPDGGAQLVPGSDVVVTVSIGATPPPSVSTPNVVGKTQADATTALTGAGLVAVPVSGYSDTVPAGSVIAQDPTAGANIPTGSEVEIEVSQGKAPAATIKVPDVVGKSEQQATDAIKSAGLTSEAAKEYSDSVAAGTVISQLPGAGTGVGPGAKVGILVSLGKQAAATATVPNVVGKKKADAESAIRSAGFVPLAEEAPSSSVPSGNVSKQLPAGGATADLGTQVAFLVSTGPAQVTVKVPDVVGKTAQEAEKVLTDAGFEPVAEEIHKPGVPAGQVFAQIPDAGSASVPGARVAIGVSAPVTAEQLPAAPPGSVSPTSGGSPPAPRSLPATP